MGKIIGVAAEKGGVAKTTTVKNVAVGLVNLGKKVLTVDLDPSGLLTKTFGIYIEEKPLDANNPEEAAGICEIFRRSIQGIDIPVGYKIVHQAEGIDIITSTERLRDYEMQMISAFQREVMLRNYLEPLREMYDYIFIDCPAGLGILTINALFCADELILPLQPHFASVESTQSLFRLIANIRRMRRGKRPEILGLLFTMVRTTTNNDIQIMERMKSDFREKLPVFDTFIPLSTNFPESDLARQSVYKHAKNSSAAMICDDLIKEILMREENL